MHGWEGIEDHLMKYDKDRVSRYSEDIDTLLVFVLESQIKQGIIKGPAHKELKRKIIGSLG